MKRPINKILCRVCRESFEYKGSDFCSEDCKNKLSGMVKKIVTKPLDKNKCYNYRKDQYKIRNKNRFIKEYLKLVGEDSEI